MPNPRPSADQARAFGARLRELRQGHGFSQEKLAMEADISLQHLSLLERGLSDHSKQSPANPRLGVLIELAKALDTEVSTLLEPLTTRFEERVRRAEEAAASDGAPEGPGGRTDLAS